jgi:hypothetical protein
MAGILTGSHPVNLKLQRDLHVLVKFVEVFCADHHDPKAIHSIPLRMHNLPEMESRQVHLCPQCTKLLQHAMVKRVNCTMSPKPACKRCPRHCYAPVYRQQMREVMRYSGRKLVLSGRLDYLWHLLF